MAIGSSNGGYYEDEFHLMASQFQQPQDDLSQPNYNTPLTSDEEKGFKTWKQENAPNDSGEDYDLRGAYLGGAKPAENGHFPDTWKKPNHPTFSNESIYAPYGNPGHWEGDNHDQYVPGKQNSIEPETQVAGDVVRFPSVINNPNLSKPSDPNATLNKAIGRDNVIPLPTK